MKKEILKRSKSINRLTKLIHSYPMTWQEKKINSKIYGVIEHHNNHILNLLKNV